MGISEIPLRRVEITDGFWSPRQQLMTNVTIPYMEKILRNEIPGAEPSNAIQNFRIAAGEKDGEFRGMVFQDSDVAKWLETAAYSLALYPDEGLSHRIDEMVSLIGRCQQENGYLNTYFALNRNEKPWSNLLECHELYCAGHMLEAGAALWECTGKEALLNICIRLADHICDTFEEGKQEGIPGHQEIEIGLIRLYHVTGNRRYLKMALRFLNLRGQDPHWFETHTPPHPDIHYGGYNILPSDTAYNQSDVPVRTQKAARGHAVRQLYMLSAMADAAAETNDTEMQAACDRLFENITERQMFVTGALGSSARGEAFTTNYDLPSDRCYGETCASVAMVLFAHRMQRLKMDGRLADIMELELYNAVLAGMQLDGTRFFYVNPLEVDLSVSGKVPGYTHVLPQRPQWHTCACCPPNLARLLVSLGKYLWGEDETTVYSHLFVGNTFQSRFGIIRLESRYPWKGEAVYTLECDASFTLAIRIPGYAGDYTISINGRSVVPVKKDGYCYISEIWHSGDTVRLVFDMAVRRIYPDPRIRSCAGKVALARGPVIYCLEGSDHPAPLSALIVHDDDGISPAPAPQGLPKDLVCLRIYGSRENLPGHLYNASLPQTVPCDMLAIPYFAWANREKADMAVWIRRM